MINDDKAKAIETKAYYTYETMKHVARLAGFKVVSNIEIADRNGTIYNGGELVKTHKHKGDCNDDACMINV